MHISRLKDRRLSLCPKCVEVRGDRRAIGMEGSVHIAQFTCPTCGYRWELLSIRPIEIDEAVESA